MASAASRFAARIVHQASASRSHWARTAIIAKKNTSKQTNSMRNANRSRGSRSASARSPAASQPKTTKAAPWTRVYFRISGSEMVSAAGSRSPSRTAAPRSAGVLSGAPAMVS